MPRIRLFPVLLLAAAAAGCAIPLLREPVRLSNDRWEIELVKLTLGPDQYNTAGGCLVPREGRNYLWATVKILNRLKTGQQFSLNRIVLSVGGKKVRPCIVDMGSVVTMRASSSPGLRPGETVSRKLVYMVRRGYSADALVYENAELVIPVTGAGCERR